VGILAHIGFVRFDELRYKLPEEGAQCGTTPFAKQATANKMPNFCTDHGAER
jgi:hypothetical protein